MKTKKLEQLESLVTIIRDIMDNCKEYEQKLEYYIDGLCSKEIINSEEAEDMKGFLFITLGHDFSNVNKFKSNLDRIDEMIKKMTEFIDTRYSHYVGSLAHQSDLLEKFVDYVAENRITKKQSLFLFAQNMYDNDMISDWEHDLLKSNLTSLELYPDIDDYLDKHIQSIKNHSKEIRRIYQQTL